MNRMRNQWMPSRLRDMTWSLLGLVCLVGIPVAAGADVVLPPLPSTPKSTPVTRLAQCSSARTTPPIPGPS